LFECGVSLYRSLELDLTSGPAFFYRWSWRWSGAVSLSLNHFYKCLDHVYAFLSHLEFDAGETEIW
jgi:hypothetical protein